MKHTASPTYTDGAHAIGLETKISTWKDSQHALNFEAPHSNTHGVHTAAIMQAYEAMKGSVTFDAARKNSKGVKPVYGYHYRFSIVAEQNLRLYHMLQKLQLSAVQPLSKPDNENMFANP